MDSFSDVWNLVLNHLKVNYVNKNRLSRIAFKLWIEVLRPDKLDGTTAVLRVETVFQRKTIVEQYSKLLKDAFYEVLGFNIELEILSDDGKSEPPGFFRPSNPQLKAGEDNEDFIQNGGFRYTFSSFIVGPSNKFAHAACVSVATNPSQTYNPLFLYGDSGLGKTHLLYSIFNEIKRRRPNTKIIYTNAEQFGAELIEALQKNKQDHSFTDHIAPFKEKYRSADVLLMDDIQFIIGKPQTEEEFFHTFDYLYQRGKQIVFTSDRAPKDMVSLTERVRNRFEMGLLADIQPPDYETRIAIIKRKAEGLNIHIPDEVCEFIANKLKSNIRQLEGVVKKIQAYKLFETQEPSLLTAQNAIRDVLTSDQPVSVTVDRIISEIAKTFSVTPEEIRSKKRDKEIAEARQVAMYVLRETTQLSQKAIGAEFSGRDHTTVIHSINSVKELIAKDQHKRRLITDIVNNIRGNS
ncbi:MAG: chromosomal replication initiator protein DnaA [Oscillospiraceae bacterium]|nr:chromosomal replication initiator protein DnaA [Oscillospiraceae bacterium]